VKRNPLQKSRSRHLRRNATPAEHRLWYHLRDRRFVGFKFRRQHAIGPYIVDYYCAEGCLVIELDGDSHTGREESDRARQHWLESHGLKVLRFWNLDLSESLDEVLECILRECHRRKPTVNA
jgi:very-short-patch-repair endonuclease